MRSAGEEVNFDGLVGPTHNYSGLSYGNVASLANKEAESNPREAALQGLEKMQFLASLGLRQGILPPHERPYLPLLHTLGYTGTDAEVWTKASKESPQLLNVCASAAAMWTANAATVTPSVDSDDGKVHFTPANLVSKLHRSIEPTTTGRILKRIFSDPAHFVHHPPLPGSYFSDEGAANHTRFYRENEGKGVYLFVWGRSSLQDGFKAPSIFPARQTLEASRSIARQHGLNAGQTIFAQQNPHAIDSGVFHNDVISVGNQCVFFCHEEAFVAQQNILDELSRKVEKVCLSPLILVLVPSRRVSLDTAVATYLFNSQLISTAEDTMALIAPNECRDTTETRSLLDEVVQDPANPIKTVHYISLRESMRNGGGPACLRLRVVLNEQESLKALQGVFLTNELYEKLKKWICKHYRDKLRPKDLADTSLIREVHTALDELTTLLQLGPIYEFQQ